MSVEEVIHAVIKICRKHSVKKVILFGSRAKGTARERSDIDIAVSGVKNYNLLLEEIELLPTLYTVDVVDLDMCRNQLLMEDINEYGQEIYKAV